MRLALCILLLSLTAQATNYYVDPDYTGGSIDGSAAHPWIYVTTSNWIPVNASLASGDVNIYFSALKADGVTQQSKAWYVSILRSNYGPNRLTLDGYSFYNANTTTPNWTVNPEPSIGVAYTNAKVFQTTGNGSQAFGWGRASGQDFVTDGGLVYCCLESHLSAADNEPGVGASWTRYWHQHGTAGAPTWTSGTNYTCYVKQNNVTMRGFDVTGSSARTGFAGDNLIWEYFYCHDTTTSGACVTLLYTTFPDGSTAVPISAARTNLVLRNFRIMNTEGEGLYLGSSNPDASEATRLAVGNATYGILVTNFYIYGAGVNGGQGDGVDCKHGIVGLHIVDAEIANGTGAGNGINLPETVPNMDQGNIIERIYVHNFPNAGGGGYGIAAGLGGTGTSGFYGHSGTTIRNCVIAGCQAAGISVGGTGAGFIVTNCAIYNCTVFNCGQGIAFSSSGGSTTTNSFCENNFVFDTGAPKGNISATGITSDYNAHNGTWTSASEGMHTLTLTTNQAEAAIVSTNTPDFHLVLGSPLIGTGLTIASFSNDKDNRLRTSPFDIGAYTFASPPGPAAYPLGVQLSGNARITGSATLKTQ